MPYLNIEDQRAAVRRHYARHPEKYKARRQARRELLICWLAEYKGTLKCSRCPEDHPACLDFHHRGEKSKAVTHLVRDSVTLKRLKAEIAKCDVLCSNCHRKLHWHEKQVVAGAGFKPAK